MIRFPCKCGHKYDEHEWVAYNGVCWADVGLSCPCMNYIPDNLQYLESIYNKKVGATNG